LGCGLGKDAIGLRERTDRAKKMEDGIRQNRMHEVNERTRGGLEKEGTRLTARRGASLITVRWRQGLEGGIRVKAG
jgi:hypothetical protein